MIFYPAFESDKITITFYPDANSSATSYKLKVYGKESGDNGKKMHIYTSTTEFPLKKGEENKHEITIDYIFYNKAAKKIGGRFLPNAIEFSFGLLIDGKETNVNNSAKFHFVRYIPKLLSIKNWVNGERLQKIWFTKGKNTDKKTVDPELDAITWEWIIAESNEVNKEFRQFHVDNIFKLKDSNVLWSNNVQIALQNEVRKMALEGFAVLPTKQMKNTKFGTNFSNIITHKSEKIPQFEKFYFNHKAFGGWSDLGLHYLFDGIDDFISAIANFNFHVYATGQLNYIERSFEFLEDYIEVNVQKLHYYVKDAFDFVDDNPNEPSQNLGFWKISDDGQTIDVVKDSPSQESEYFEVKNVHYNNYRDDVNMGYDFYLYSTIHEENVNLKFRL